MSYHEDAFEAAVEIVSAAMEENEVEISAEGGEQVADFFGALYKRLRKIADGEEDEAEAPAKPGSFEIYKDGAGEYRFRLKACNGQVIAVSEGYTTKAACLNGVESVQRSTPGALVKEA